MSFKSAVLFLTAVFAVFFTTLYVDAFLGSNTGATSADMPVIMRMLGESRNIASNLAFLQADLYYHRGIGHPEGPHEEEHMLDNEGAAEVYVTHLHPAGDIDSVPKFYENPLLWISYKIETQGHYHMEGEDLKEVMPWLYYATKLDPYNVAAYTITAYYLAERFEKPVEAVSLLRQGMALNPDAWEIPAEMGMLEFRYIDDARTAIRFLQRAEELLERTDHDNYDERKVLTPLAYSYLEAGEKVKALKVFKQLNILFPGTVSFREKILELEEQGA